MKIINVVGARPNFMKIAPLMSAYKNSSKIEPILLHTGQHYDENMSRLFFDELGIPKPDIYLGIGSAGHAVQTARIMEKFDEVCSELKPDAVLVVGDVNSTMACSLVAVKIGVKIIHLEAGLRSLDREMPEEINRIVTDVLADLLLTPSKDADENLLKEGIAPDKIKLVGNIMIDTLFRFLPLAKQSKVLDNMKLEPNGYALVTMHRPSNVDNYENLKKILATFAEIQERVKIVFPMHPRTLSRISEFGLEALTKAMPQLIITEPIGYLDFQKLMSNSKLVITDSGGIQEETTALGIPCITVRKNTERPVTVWQGTNELVGLDMEKLLELSIKAIDGNWKKGSVPELWDGKTAIRTVKALEELV